MVKIRLMNSMTRRKEDFVPLDPANVRIYVCGPTVYDRAHLGNARPVVVFDTLYRLLRHVYGAGSCHLCPQLHRCRRQDQRRGVAPSRRWRARHTGGADPSAGPKKPSPGITPIWTRWARCAPIMSRAQPNTSAPMIAMISDLIAKGHAYAREGHVLFRVRSYSEYGALSGRSVDDMIAGARVEVAPFKEDPMDFVLWKPSSGDEPGWDSPWGRGRPGWHIECSAMSYELLGPSFDIHGGGLDLQFPHHENEIAQSRCAHPQAGFANVWLHNEMLQVEGKKMSKSLGNFFTVRDLLDQGVPGEVIRMVYLGTHYSKPMDWTKEKAEQAEIDFAENGAEFLHGDPATNLGFDWRNVKPPQEFVEALANDLNTSLALTLVNKYLKNMEEANLVGSANFTWILSRQVETQNFCRLSSGLTITDKHLGKRQVDLAMTRARILTCLTKLGEHLFASLRQLAMETKGLLKASMRNEVRR
jgi:cysteinyl-tRNA synthetase